MASMRSLTSLDLSGCPHVDDYALSPLRNIIGRPATQHKLRRLMLSNCEGLRDGVIGIIATLMGVDTQRSNNDGAGGTGGTGGTGTMEEGKSRGGVDNTGENVGDKGSVNNNDTDSIFDLSDWVDPMSVFLEYVDLSNCPNIPYEGAKYLKAAASKRHTEVVCGGTAWNLSVAVELATGGGRGRSDSWMSHRYGVAERLRPFY